jgi:hypothetical protein
MIASPTAYSAMTPVAFARRRIEGRDGHLLGVPSEPDQWRRQLMAACAEDSLRSICGIG